MSAAAGSWLRAGLAAALCGAVLAVHAAEGATPDLNGVWQAVEKRRAVLITYTSAWTDREREKSEREQIVASFRWT